MFEYVLQHQDGGCHARRGHFVTRHGPVQLPTFMPVGTGGTVKGLTIDLLSLNGLNSSMLLPERRHSTKDNSRLNPALCAGALTRLLWSCCALLLLWATVYWALCNFYYY